MAPHRLETFPQGFTDVLIEPTHTGADAINDFQRPPEKLVPLGPQLYLGRLSTALADRIFDACSVRGENMGTVFRQYGQRHTFIRHPAPGPRLHWDSDQRIWEAIALSRMIRANTFSTTFAARVIVEGDRIEIAPLSEQSDSRYFAYVGRTDQRTWFSESEAHALRRLVWHYGAARSLPPRISYAIWLLEMAARNRSLAARWPLVASSLESLVKTDKGRAADQFIQRVPRLTSLVASASNRISKASAEDFYERRSDLSHGNRVAFEASGADGAELQRFETVARAALFRTIVDSAFRRAFTEKTRVRSLLEG